MQEEKGGAGTTRQNTGTRGTQGDTKRHERHERRDVKEDRQKTELQLTKNPITGGDKIVAKAICVFPPLESPLNSYAAVEENRAGVSSVCNGRCDGRCDDSTVVA